jgi:hypothetical protein
MVDEVNADKFMDNIIGIFKMKGTVIEEGLQAIGSLAENISSRFLKYLNTVMPFVIWCIDNSSSSLCKSGVIACGDFSRALGEDFGPQIPSVIHKLLSILENQQQMFEVKIRVIDTLADFASHNAGITSNYLPTIFKFIGGAAELSLNLNNEINSEYFECFLQLREAIMSFYVGIIQGLHDKKQEEIVNGYMPGIVEYALQVVQDRYKPSLDIHIGAIGLIGDIASYFGSKLVQLIRSPLANDYLAAAARFEDKTIKEILAYTNERIKLV